MNNAPKLNIQIRIGTAIVALAATFVVLYSVDALSAHYAREEAVTQLAANGQLVFRKG